MVSPKHYRFDYDPPIFPSNLKHSDPSGIKTRLRLGARTLIGYRSLNIE